MFYGTKDLANDPDNNPFQHNEGRPFCSDDSCICREDQESIDNLNNHVLEGLATTQDANNIYRGRIV
jgi:hypothetical protein